MITSTFDFPQNKGEVVKLFQKNPMSGKNGSQKG